jgi:hypothetical protein
MIAFPDVGHALEHLDTCGAAPKPEPLQGVLGCHIRLALYLVEC